MLLTIHRFAPPAVAVIALGLFIGSPALAGAERIQSEGVLVSLSPLVPSGATAKVEATYPASGTSIVALQVRGLRPLTSYGAQAHLGGCGSPGDLATPREIWLNVFTDEAGTGVVETTLRWQFPPDRHPQSLIIHAGHGERLACLSGEF